jgi:hypothetical protein
MQIPFFKAMNRRQASVGTTLVKTCLTAGTYDRRESGPYSRKPSPWKAV